MPIYEYACKKCGHRFEVIQKFSDKPISKCESCGGKVAKVIAPPALMFKGTGWYVTDYSEKGKERDSKEKAGKEQKKDTPAGKEKESKKVSTETNKSEKK